MVGIGSIHPQGTRYSLKGRINVKFRLKFETLQELQAFLKERNIFTTPWGKQGAENIRNLELYQAKKENLASPDKIRSFVRGKSKTNPYYLPNYSQK